MHWCSLPFSLFSYHICSLLCLRWIAKYIHGKTVSIIFVQSLIVRSRFASTLTILQLFASIETHRGDRKAEMDRFVCLAEYGCRCRPPGKPVDKSTMKRHRAISNKKRASLGLPKLPRGPRHSFSASQSVSNHFYRL